MFDEWNSAIWWVVFGRRRFGGSMLVCLNDFALEFVVCLTFRTTHGYVTWHGDFFSNFHTCGHVGSLCPIAANVEGLQALFVPCIFGNVEISRNLFHVPNFRTMTIPANLLQHKLIDAPLQLKTWADLEVVVMLRHGRQVGFEFFCWEMLQSIPVQNSSQLLQNFTKQHFFLSKKDVFCFTNFVQRMEWPGLECSKGTSDISSSLGFPGFDVLFCCCCFFFFQRMEFVVENPQVGWKKVVWKIVVICRQIGRLFEL